MTISLYDATVAGWLQHLPAVDAILAKAQAFAAEKGVAEAELVEARIHPDMLPLGFQVKWTVTHSVGALAGVRAGQVEPDRALPPATLAGLREHVAAGIAALKAVDPAEVEAMVALPVMFSVGEMKMPFTGGNFLLSFSLPNFHFHATTAYDILRMRGVDLGKRDYLGMPRMSAPA